MKRCITCNVEKSIDEFGLYAAYKDGINASCKACRREYNANYRAANLQRTRELDREQKRRQREREGPEVTRAKWREWYANNREYRLEYELERETRNNFAKRQVQLAIERGELVRPDECSECKVECVPDAHHYDYDTPLDVTWLCIDCHSSLHVELRETVNSL